MFYLLEAKYTDKESQALYTKYQTETEIIGVLEKTLGQQMKDENCGAELLIAFDHTGKILQQAYHSKKMLVLDEEGEPKTDEYNDFLYEEPTLSPRLVWIPVDAEGEHSNMQKYSTALEAEAYYHVRLGEAMTNADNKAILTMLVGGTGVSKKDYWVRPIEPVVEGE